MSLGISLEIVFRTYVIHASYFSVYHYTGNLCTLMHYLIMENSHFKPQQIDPPWVPHAVPLPRRRHWTLRIFPGCALSQALTSPPESLQLFSRLIVFYFEPTDTLQGRKTRYSKGSPVDD